MTPELTPLVATSALAIHNTIALCTDSDGNWIFSEADFHNRILPQWDRHSPLQYHFQRASRRYAIWIPARVMMDLEIHFLNPF